MKKSLAKKMILDRETLRRLAGSELQSVNGGASPNSDVTRYAGGCI